MLILSQYHIFDPKKINIYSVGWRGVNSSFKLFLPVFATRSGGGEGIRGLWSKCGGRGGGELRGLIQ
jgi:hypothetical protein